MGRILDALEATFDAITVDNDLTVGGNLAVTGDVTDFDTLVPASVPTITGDHVVDTADVLKDLLTALATLGLIVDETAEV